MLCTHEKENTLRRLVLLLLPMLLMALAACSGGNTDAQTSVTAAPTQAVPTAAENLAADENGQPLVARVNGEGIPHAEFERALVRQQQEFSAADNETLAAAVLSTLIQQKLIEQAARDLNIGISDEALDSEIQTNIELAGGQAGWEEWLAQNLYTEAEYRDTLRAMLLTGAVRDAVTQAASGALRHVHARHILVKSEQEAKDLLTRLQNGEDFAALAQQYSQDVTSFDKGGDLGWFIDGELLEPALSQVAFSLLPGQIAGPVATRLGYHIIQTLEFADRQVDPEKMAVVVQVQFENWLQSLIESATIERYR